MPTTILVVEPDRKLLASIKTLLTNKHYEVFCAATSERGTKILYQKEIDLILCDTQLNNISGIDFLETLIKSHAAELIPFMFITSHIIENEAQLAMSLGADGFILKPINQETFLSIIERKLKKYNQTRIKSIQKHLEINSDQRNIKAFSENIFMFRMVNKQPTFIKISDMKYIVAKGAYLEIHLSTGHSYRKRRRISELEKKLPPDNFLRIHRSTIINLEHVEKVEKWFSNSFRVYLKGVSTPFEMSRRYASALRTF